ncbi:hypothetical protein Zmor_014687 [Zophobas morio]|uniref:Carboxylic ester hydrolase n=1 Tax=Zophobas morio TaxID=2755281 RepID=A0AA38IID1_9CUCU|nr:hypothetical protein Zmor_014687 [Zophobas morio]
MLVITLLMVYISYVTHILPYPEANPLVYTRYGPIIGLTQFSRNKREYMSFRGIPYAKPPLGNLRFKAPEPVEPWTFAINATRDAPYCIQKNYFFANPRVEGSEDCLYLNIYIPKTENNHLLPVMIFIHWGGFFAGRGSSDTIGPEYIMDKDVILVTFNYRLGVFGFFSTLDDAAPGNFGLKDQTMALKFVYENIECFGGDKNRITLSGQSAGSGSVSLHLISPLSKGLFQQAISQSGAALNLWAKPINALQPNITAALAVFTGCTNYLGNNIKLVNCLREVEATALAETADKFKYFSIEPLTPYTIVTEITSDSNPNPFLTKDPLEYLQAGEFMKIPWIIGTTQDEGILRVSQLTRQPEILKTLNANFSSLIPQILGLQLSVGLNTSQLYQNIINFYLGGDAFVDVSNPRSIQGFIDLYSDRAFIYGIYQSIVLQSRKGHKPIWVYNFDYKGRFTYGDLFAATPNNINFKWGVSHCDDLLYLFRSPALFPDLDEAMDLHMSDSLLALWTNFIIYGDPDPLQVIKWRSQSLDNTDHVKNIDLIVLNITGSYDTNIIEYKIQNGFNAERIQFWIHQNLAENFPELS